MLLNCPTCARTYTVSHTDIGAGRTVICPSCQTQWFAGGPALPAATNDDMSVVPRRKHVRSARQLAAGHAAPNRAMLKHVRFACAATATLAVVTGAVTLRERIVSHVPKMASLYASVGLRVNVRGLAFEMVSPVRLPSTDVSVSGAIRNIAGRRVTVPRIAYEVRDASGAPLLSWSESVAPKTLGAGKTLAFESSPHHMPAESRTVTVRFLTGDEDWSRRKLADRSLD